MQPHELSVLLACRNNGPMIDGLLTHNGAAVDGTTLLWAIGGLESTHGRDRLHVRTEPAYSPGGIYYVRSPDLQASWAIYGTHAASSFGSFQILFQTARELGFKGQPIELQDDEVCGAMAAVLIVERIVRQRGAKTLTQVLSGYNAGVLTALTAYVRNGTHLYLEGLPA